MSDHAQGPGWWMASDGKWYPPAGESSESRRPWWRRPVPLWALLLTFVVGLALGAAAGTGDESDDAETADVTTTEAERTTTTRRETTTTEAPTTTTTEAPTTTLSPEEQQAAAKAEFARTFDATRSDVAEVLQSDSNIETLDQFTFDPATDRVTVAVTSMWASPDNQVDGAWKITRAMAVLWERDTGPWCTPGYMPHLELVNSGTRYQCAADLMVRLGSLEANRDHWAAEC